MKLPKTFRPEKNLEEKTAQLMDDSHVIDRYSRVRVKNLLKYCDEFLKVAEEEDARRSNVYNLAKNFARDLDYTMLDVEELAKRLKDTFFGNCCQGFYLSALINKIITDDKPVILNPVGNLDGLGAYLQKGSLVVHGKIGMYLGYGMEGGNIEVHGDVCAGAGYKMKGGIIRVEGNTMRLGYEMHGGEIYVNGHIELIPNSCKGKIYEYGKLIWPKRTFDDILENIDRNLEKLGVD